jgi:hypothetical protein
MQIKTITHSILPLLTLLLAACSTPTFKDTPSGEFGDQGLYPVKSTGFDEVHARRDAALEDYRTVNIESLNLEDVRFTTTTMPGTVRRDWTITPEREQVMTEVWAGSMDRAFSEYQRAEEGEQVLRISAALTQIWPRSRSMAGSPAGVPGAVSGDLVNVSIEIRLHDQASGDLLAVIRDSRDAPLIQWTQANGRNMVSLFNSWAGLLHARVAGQ